MMSSAARSRRARPATATGDAARVWGKLRKGLYRRYDSALGCQRSIRGDIAHGSTSVGGRSKDAEPTLLAVNHRPVRQTRSTRSVARHRKPLLHKSFDPESYSWDCV
ncbi:MAG: hypothetical protein JWN03_5291 [Nocardia sp.]|nr:hypothetical protein [Nocardia sp.]